LISVTTAHANSCRSEWIGAPTEERPIPPLVRSSSFQGVIDPQEMASQQNK
jgi:hypothetical protein